MSHLYQSINLDMLTPHTSYIIYVQEKQQVEGMLTPRILEHIIYVRILTLRT